MILDKNRIYQLEDYTFVNFANLDSNMVENIRIWRNHYEVRKVMYTSEEISAENHRRFIESLANRDDKAYWLVCRNNEPLGVVSIVDIDHKNNTAELGYYLLPQNMGKGNGIEFNIIIKLFLLKIIGCTSLHGRTAVKNKKALFINYYLGCEFKPETVYINGVPYIEFSLTKDQLLKRQEIIHNSKDILDIRRDFKNIYNKYLNKLESWT